MKNTLLTFLLLLIYNLSALSQSVFSGIKTHHYSKNSFENQKRGVVARCDSSYQFNSNKKLERKFYFFYDKNKFIKEEWFVIDKITQKFRLNVQKVYDYDLKGNLISSKKYEWNTELKKLSLYESIDYVYTLNSLLSKKTESNFEETSIISSAFNPTKKNEQLFTYDGNNCIERITITSNLNQTTQKYNQSLTKEEFDYDNKGNIININSYSGDSLQGKWNRINQFITRKFNDKNQLIYKLDSSANMEGYLVLSMKYTIKKEKWIYNDKNELISIDRYSDIDRSSSTKLESRRRFEYAPIKERFFAKQSNKDLDTINPYTEYYILSNNASNDVIINSYYFKTYDEFNKLTSSSVYQLKIDNTISANNPMIDNDLDPFKSLKDNSRTHSIENDLDNALSYNKVLNLKWKNIDDSSETEFYYSTIETASISKIQDSNLSISPNPNTGKFSINNIQPQTNFSVLDINGRLIYQSLSDSDKIEIDLECIAKKGIYFLQATLQGNLVGSEKIVIE